MAGLRLSDHKGRVSRDSRRDSFGARLRSSTSSSSGAGKSRMPTPPSRHGDDYDDSEDASDESSADGRGESADEGEGESSSDEDFTLETHLGLLERRADQDELNEIKTAPIFTDSVRKYAISVTGKSPDQPFTQFGLIAGDVSHPAGAPPADPRIFYNVSAPSSVFICGSQGSGKSHSLSCLLENCLIPSKANTLPRPLTGIVFHFDTFISDNGGSPCEAAWLSSSRDVKVRVLCAPTNVRTIRQVYQRFPNVKVEELRLSQLDLNTKRMLDLMAVTSGNMPLYLHVVNRILRDLRITQQKSGKGFDYTTFKRMVQAEDLTKDQLAPLKQRLDTLESFMVEDQAKAYNMWAKERSGHSPKQQRKHEAQGTDWTPEAGQLTIVDLSCPCVTSEMACSLFNICLSLFLEQPSKVGRVIALDEAHKYMNDSPESQTLTESLLATIRLQRHLGARIIISTQEPTVSPKLLDLCSVTIVHRFTSPDWLAALKKHLAGVSTASQLLEQAAARHDGDAANGDGHGHDDGVGAVALGRGNPSLGLFSQIVGLRVGEALVFAPSAIVGVRVVGAAAAAGGAAVRRLGNGVLKVRVRRRVTADGGRSIMAL
ncbi:hypothetical protein QBC33DRAFT_448798 [Phialemonium atrogriseum]|uniref:Zona occludens toxin N-terminal domain-containing protein n=1 Tax=Phialemonium atrogriseum TaxID=1093897 RepID=A0AAJ0FHT9_9PEZI|nr:uncharacterized protein QBC33DRAFT_448798 [Phialemonium atrogriseum]KAK1768941.1 hypothetical protein QBC33DRAFT_448798 [Phialemonium atrogriseum]